MAFLRIPCPLKNTLVLDFTQYGFICKKQCDFFPVLTQALFSRLLNFQKKNSDFFPSLLIIAQNVSTV